MADKDTQKEVHEEQGRFVITVDGAEAGFAEYQDLDNGVRNFNHTVVDSAYKGQGLSKILIKEALDNAKSNNLSVKPTCSCLLYTSDAADDLQPV